MGTSNDNINYTKFSTKCIHNSLKGEKWPGNPIVPGIILSTTFKQKSAGIHYGFDYSRSGNPTRQLLEESLADLENARYGLTFSSGLGALTTLCCLFECGDEIVSIDDVYGGSSRLLNACVSKWGIITKMVDICDENKLITSLNVNKTKMVLIESPTNPLLKVVDINKVVNITKKVDPRILVIVDNTFLSPYFQKPLELGADIVMHSITKYINGHSDVLMGCMMFNNEELYKKLLFLQNAIGAVPSPFECYLVLRGIKTLALRMEKHYENGLKISKYLENHLYVEKVYYPALPSHPSYEIFKRQTTGMSGMISFVLKGDIKATNEFVQSLKLFSLAESLGGFESLVEIPSIMTHASIHPDHRKKIGLSDSLIRISVGIEDATDLINDLQQAFDKCFPIN